MTSNFKARNSKKERLCVAQTSPGKQCKKLAIVGADPLNIVFPYCESHDEDFAYEYKICKEPNCSVWIHHDLNDVHTSKDYCFIHGGKAVLYLGGSYKRALEFFTYQSKKRCLWRAKNGKRCATIPDLTTDCVLLPYCSKHTEQLNHVDLFTLCKNQDCERWVSASAKVSAYCSKHGGNDYLQGTFEDTELYKYGMQKFISKPRAIKR